MSSSVLLVSPALPASPPELDLIRVILDTLVAIAPEADPDALDPERAFRDQIELDSVDFLSFVMALEKRLDRPIPVVDFPRLSSLQGCLQYLTS